MLLKNDIDKLADTILKLQDVNNSTPLTRKEKRLYKKEVREFNKLCLIVNKKIRRTCLYSV